MEESGIEAAPIEPVQRKKAKRTARACDECRMRKSKCDGLQPCEACQTTDRYCTYNLSAGRSTGSGTRIRILEDRLRRARAYLNEAQKRTPSLANVNFDALLGPMDDYVQTDRKPSLTSDDDDSQERLASMMDSYGQMTIGNDGGMHRDFYGAASGLAWIRKTGDYFENSESSGSDDSDSAFANSSATVQLFDAPLPPKHTITSDSPVPHLLPPRETTAKLLQIVFNQVYPIYHFLFIDDFQSSTDRIYNRDPSEYTESDQSFLPLLYLVVALGFLFSREEHERRGCKESLAQAMKHFIEARKMLDIAHLRTIVSLQAIVSLILFLISTARMASAHAFMGAACASAMRQGLHYRSTHEADMSESERRVRRRVFWSVMNLDMYISGILGLPPFMDLTAVDPAIDTTIEHALREAKIPASQSSAENLALKVSAKHIELMRIVFRAQRALYPKPTDPPDNTSRNGTIMVSVAKLQQVETQFREWAQKLTHILTHPSDSPEAISIKYEMYICYYFSQIVLYRPFLHYLAKPSSDDGPGQRQMGYAQTCVRMASKVVEVSVEHQRRGLLCPASWTSVYTVFISVVCLIFSYATREQHPTPQNGKKDIENGIQLLASTACTTDTGSVRCLEILRRLLKRVSYAVDIDLDRICADTKPCCSIDFDPKDQTITVNEFGEPHMRDGESEGSGSSGFQSVWMPPTASSRPVAFSQDITMTSPSEADYGYTRQESIQPQSHFANSDEILEIPYHAQFQWESGPGERQSPSSEPLEQSRTSGTPSQFPNRLTAEDIAAFVHSNQVGTPHRRPGT